MENGGRGMNTQTEISCDLFASPNHVTFTILDERETGHSVSVGSLDFPDLLRASKSALKVLNRSEAFKGAMHIFRQNVKCAPNCCVDRNDLLYSFFTALLKHPRKQTGKTVLLEIDVLLKKYGGAHVILVMPPNGPSVWSVVVPSNDEQKPQ
jgi:hypothetical protein